MSKPPPGTLFQIVKPMGRDAQGRVVYGTVWGRVPEEADSETAAPKNRRAL